MYKLLIDGMTKQLATTVIRLTDNSWIPFDPDNSDYKAYLIWLAEGNTPELAEGI